MLLDHRLFEQLREVHRELPVHQAVDPQLPGGGVHPRHREGGVDPIEICVRGDERRHPLELHLGLRRDQLRGAARRGKHELGGPAGHLAARGDAPCGRGADHGEQADGADAEQRSATRPASPRVVCVGGGVDGPQQEQQGGDRDHGADQGGQHVEHGVLGAGEHEDHREHPEAGQQRGGQAGTGVPEPADERREQGMDRDHRGEQNHLVPGAEQAYHQVLHRRRDDVDEGAADGHERCGGGAEGEGGELRDSHQHHPRGHSGRRRPAGGGLAGEAGAAGVDGARGRSGHVSTPLAIGSIDGWSEPPSGSMVRPTATPAGIVPSWITASAESSSSPALTMSEPSIIQS